MLNTELQTRYASAMAPLYLKTIKMIGQKLDAQVRRVTRGGELLYFEVILLVIITIHGHIAIRRLTGMLCFEDMAYGHSNPDSSTPYPGMDCDMTLEVP